MIDISGSLFTLLVLSPLLLITALLIKLFDRGPLIFVQQRVGKHGQLFSFYKFRSMPVNTGDIPSDKIGQVKLTWIGRVIRRTSIDELPQLINILKGDMSLVGPRPAINSQQKLIAERKNNGAIEMRPGLTGLAQVNSFDGMTVEEKAHFDGVYYKQVSFLTDVKIVLKTVTYLFKAPPVY
ncbi:sugar transferase [Pseudoalteromonas sp. JC3]|uniref:sugar transferase n=1 Tax=Pseudoalteromonas sp. JC3 TaxID=2810196 RepID=UPI00257028E3|nr:sugar transferase [Pseudoalteromonas sp. JC3]WJE09429.1 sugar transferase [Pseudoalteromonas sp. JC3]